MNKASPIEMRKALEIVETFKKVGILFVPMPVRSKEELEQTVAEMQHRLDEAAKES
jgi:hypothetical protein